jgi:hypothetical protein
VRSPSDLTPPKKYTYLAALGAALFADDAGVLAAVFFEAFTGVFFTAFFAFFAMVG